MIKVQPHHLQLKINSPEYLNQKQLESFITYATKALFGLEYKHFEPNTKSDKNILTFRGLISLELKKCFTDHTKFSLASITVHGSAFESFNGLKSVFELIDIAKKFTYRTLPSRYPLNFVAREIHFKIRVPLHTATFSDFKECLLDRKHVVTRAYIGTVAPPYRGWESSFYVGSGGSRPTNGKRFSFYYAANKHPEALPGEADIELQLFGPSEVSEFLEEVGKHGLETAFFSRLTSAVDFKDPASLSDSNQSRRPQADFWLKITEGHSKIRNKKKREEPKLENRLKTAQAKIYGHMLSLTAPIYLDALRRELKDKGLTQQFVASLLEDAMQIQNDRVAEEELSRF